MKLNKPNSKFYKWWNSYTGRRIVSAAYSLGASIVIMGAMFKILHLPLGNYMLGIGMSVESLIFALGIFDKPYREFDWSRIFNFKAETDDRLDATSISSAVAGGVQTAFFPPMQNQGSELSETSSDSPQTHASGSGVGGGGGIVGGGGGVVYIGGGGGGASYPHAADVGEYTPSERTETQVGGGSIQLPNALSEEDVVSLSEGIKNLSITAENLQKLANVALAANDFAEKIESASNVAGNFAESQEKLNNTARILAEAYENVNSEMGQVVNSTQNYSEKIGTVNSSISSINSIYEIQLKHLNEQTERLNQQAEAIRRASEQIDSFANDMGKMKEAANISQIESQRYHDATRKLTRQVEDLNNIYGNMLNALS